MFLLPYTLHMKLKLFIFFLLKIFLIYSKEQKTKKQHYTSIITFTYHPELINVKLKLFNEAFRIFLS